MTRSYFLLIDPQKNTLQIPVDNEFLNEIFKNRDLIKNIKRHKTKRELSTEISNYLKGGSKDEQSREN